ncbi:DUF6538 domain-containing protein [Sagittula salina]|uniref:DUF6538 domain-containing protein n=1 Tax=Sagittula salina TaxID=2820268 RepID=UPI00315898FA
MAKTTITPTSVPFSFVKAGIFYFSRRVPRDLRHRYSSSRVSYSPRSRSSPRWTRSPVGSVFQHS